VGGLDNKVKHIKGGNSMTKKEYNIRIVDIDTKEVIKDLGNHKFMHDVNEPAYSEYFARTYGEDYMQDCGIDTGELEVVVSEV
jgi:hypothetical protein